VTKNPEPTLRVWPKKLCALGKTGSMIMFYPDDAKVVVTGRNGFAR
jgi:hypothetical protein